jgi:hypothetical protein
MNPSTNTLVTHEFALALMIQQDGKLVAAGTRSRGGFTLTRHLP